MADERVHVGVKEALHYRDIEWLMPSVDVEGVLERLGVKVTGRSRGEIYGFCPDHHLFTGHEPSHPKWWVNPDTGQTYCSTESRGSNLVWTVARLLGCHPKKAASFLLGGADVDMSSLRIAGLVRKMSQLRDSAGSEPVKEPVVGLNEVRCELENRNTSDRMYEFFMRPPGKKPTNIRPETVDRFMVSDRTYGSYAGRAIIPSFFDGELVGFVAIDMLGEEARKKANPHLTGYRKTLTATHFEVGDHLYGYDDCERDAPYVILVEGNRECMKLWQEGFPNSLGCYGSKVCSGQVRLLASLNPKLVVLMFDGDEKGMEATDRNAERLSRNFRVAKCFVPYGFDPKNLEAEMIKKCLNVAIRTSAGCQGLI